MNSKIYQIYYLEEQKDKLDPAFIPYDNIENPRPELQEWYVWDKLYQQCVDENLDYWGIISWKFHDKTNLTGEQFVSYIEQNPGYDVYFVNPAIVNEAVFLNGWEQGDVHHPNLSNIGTEFFEKIGYTDISLKETVLDRNVMMFANYFVASREFWTKLMDISRKIFSEAEDDPEFKRRVFAAGLSNYNLNKALPNFPFIIERLASTLIELEGYRSLPFAYSADTLAEKYHPYVGELQSLSNLKVLINRYESDELYEIWNFYRYQFLQKNPSVLGLE